MKTKKGGRRILGVCAAILVAAGFTAAAPAAIATEDASVANIHGDRGDDHGGDKDRGGDMNRGGDKDRGGDTDRDGKPIVPITPGPNVPLDFVIINPAEPVPGGGGDTGGGGSIPDVKPLVPVTPFGLPSAVAGLTATLNADGSIDLHWNAQLHADSYAIFQNGFYGEELDRGSTSATSFHIPGDGQRGEPNVTVIAHNSLGYGTHITVTATRATPHDNA